MSTAPPSARRARTRIAGVVACAAVLAACGSDGPDALLVAPLDRAAAIAAAVDVRTTGCGPRMGLGTGAVIEGGAVITAAHVVAGRSAVEVIDTDGDRAAAQVVLFDPANDVAVLRPESPVGTPLPLRSVEARADEVGIVVLPRLADGLAGGTSGTTSDDADVGVDMAVEVDVVEVRVLRTVNIATTDIYRETDVVRRGFELDAAIEPGDSGALVVLPGGGAGIVWARSNRAERRAWAIDLPAAVVAGKGRGAERDPVDVGECPPG